MENEPQNLSTEFNTPFGLGRIIEKSKSYTASDGRKIELKNFVITMPDGRGNYITYDKTIPSRLDDGIVLTEETYPFLRECSKCGAVIINFCFCNCCGLFICWPCSTEEEVKDGIRIRVCGDCAKKIRHPVLFSIEKLIWGK